MGLGRRTFSPGEVLTASNVMNYLQDQAVMSFAGTAVQEGMVSYLQDLNQLDVYDGSGWKQFYPSVANAGEIIQMVTTSSTTAVSSTTTTFVSTGLSVTLTPYSSSSKIIIMVSYPALNNSAAASFHTVFRGNVTTGVNLGAGTQTALGQLYAPSLDIRTIMSYQLVDTPNTSSSITYTSAIAGGSNGAATAMHENRKGTMTVLEVKG